VDNDDGVVALTRHVLDERISLVPERQVVAISRVRVDGDVSLAAVGIDEDDALVGLASDSGSGDVVEVVEHSLDDGIGVRALEVVLDGGERVDEVRVVHAARSPALSEGTLVAASISAGVGTIEVGSSTTRRASAMRRAVRGVGLTLIRRYRGAG
jgi:hypothetical protein